MKHPLLLTALLVLGFASPSHAQVVLFYNLLQPTSGSGDLGLIHNFASDFTTDGTPRTITSLTAQMGNLGSFDTRIVTFSIFTDNGRGKPGTLVSIFDTLASVPPNSFGFITVTSSGIALQPNTSYWVVGQMNPPGNVNWGFTISESSDSGPFTTVPGTQMQHKVFAEGYSDFVSGNFKFVLEGDITSVPEPHAGFTLLVTVGTFVTFRRWRSRSFFRL